MFMLERLIGFVAPHDCLGCEDEGSLLCEMCRFDLEPIPERCYRCHTQTVDNRTCEKCRKHSALRHVWVATDYDDTAKKLVQCLKFGRAAAASRPISRHIFDKLPYQDSGVIVVSVPTASNRVRQRGYDQADLIARQAADALKLEHAALLLRFGHSRQVGASRKQRLEQLRDAFRVPYGKLDYVRGKDILLIDDIVTTGATLESAARALKDAGAKSVSAAVFAAKQ